MVELESWGDGGLRVRAIRIIYWYGNGLRSAHGHSGSEKPTNKENQRNKKQKTEEEEEE